MQIPISRGYAFAVRGTHKPTAITLHESGTPSLSGTVSSLLKKGLGVHAAVTDSALGVRFFNPPSDLLYHGGPLNKGSVGIEYVFSPVATHPSNAGRPKIAARWVWRGGSYPNPRGLYALPNLDNLEALYTVAHEYAKVLGFKLKCPDEPLGEKVAVKELFSRYTVFCHGRDPGSSHTDGWFQELYIKMRTEGKLPQQALDAVVESQGGLVQG